MTAELTVKTELSRAKRAVLVEWAAGALLVIAAVGLLFLETAPTTILLSSASLLFAGVWLTYLTVNFRLHVSPEQDPLGAAEELRAAKLRWFAFVQRALIAAGLFCLLWTPLQLREHAGFYSREPWRAVVGMGSMFAILGTIAALNRHQRRQLTHRRAAR